MSSFLQKNVLVTGGAGGIGRLLSEKVLKAGADNLIIWDKDTDLLSLTVDQLTEAGFPVHAYVVNLTDLEQIRAAGKMVLNEIGPVDILFNNAGSVIGEPFVHNTPEQIDQVIRVNVLGVMQTTRAFLPAMIERNSGHIVNISSAAGLMANPKMSVYVGSKWAVTGWSESLRLELEALGKELHVTTVQPGYIHTGLFEGVKAPVLTPILDPDAITDKIFRAVEHNKIFLREPFMVKLVPFLKGVMPTRFFDFLADKLFRVYSSMETFKGRNESGH